MAIFSVSREEEDKVDEEAGPSSSTGPNPKRRKLIITQTQGGVNFEDEEEDDQFVIDVGRSREEELNFEEEDDRRWRGEEEEEEEEEGEESEHEMEAEEEESEHDHEDNHGQEENDDEGDEEGLEIYNHHHHQRQPQLEAIEESNRDGPVSVTLTDPDVLDCPICLDSLSIPLFQCDNGHIACSSCCTKIANRCPSCSLPIGYNRCRAMEKLLESVQVSCRNTKYGCEQMVKFTNKHEHENACLRAPCSCPILDCNFVGHSVQLYSHFELRHSTSAKNFLFNKPFTVSLEKSQRYLFLQETDESIIFVLKHFRERHGSAINVVCIAPSPKSAHFSYDLVVREGDTSIKLRSSVESTPKWVDCPPVKKFLLVPNHYSSTRGQLKLDVCIWEPTH